MSDHGHLFDEVKTRVAAGVSKKDLFDSIKIMTSDPSIDDATAGKLRGYAAKLFQRAEAEERTWTGVSTNDRIDAAFEVLSQRGIFSAQNFTCCSSCGHGEAAGIMGETKARGYVFYHQQDTERGVVGGGLMLAYGAHDGEDASVIAIGREICAELDRFGIPHSWNGSPSTRIEILPFEWRKRRTTKSPPIPMHERGVVIDRPPDAAADPAPAPPRYVLRHPDGREWSAELGWKELTLRIRDTDGDVHERTVRCDDPRVEVEKRMAELREDGFS